MSRSDSTSLRKTTNGLEISIYQDNKPTQTDIELAVGRLSIAFPKTEKAFLGLLTERLIANGFTAQRLKDAVNHVLDNFQYKEINISDLIRFDRTYKLYTYNDYCEMITTGKAQDGDFEKRKINEKMFWYLKKDKLK